VQELGREEFGVDGDKVGLEGVLKGFPCAKVGWGMRKRGLLPVLSPFSSGGAEFEVGKGRGDSFTDRGVQVLVEEVIVGEVRPKCFGIGGGTIKWFRGGAQGFSGRGSGSHCGSLDGDWVFCDKWGRSRGILEPSRLSLGWFFRCWWWDRLWWQRLRRCDREFSRQGLFLLFRGKRRTRARDRGDGRVEEGGDFSDVGVV
jgi:hypothetical protein